MLTLEDASTGQRTEVVTTNDMSYRRLLADREYQSFRLAPNTVTISCPHHGPNATVVSYTDGTDATHFCARCLTVHLRLVLGTYRAYNTGAHYDGIG